MRAGEQNTSQALPYPSVCSASKPPAHPGPQTSPSCWTPPGAARAPPFPGSAKTPDRWEYMTLPHTCSFTLRPLLYPHRLTQVATTSGRDDSQASSRGLALSTLLCPRTAAQHLVSSGGAGAVQTPTRSAVLTGPPCRPPHGPHTWLPCCGSPELPAQLLEEKTNGKEAQRWRSGKDASPVILQVPPQAAGEGLSGKGAERRAAGHTAAAELRTRQVLGKRASLPPPTPGLPSPGDGHHRHPSQLEARSPGPQQILSCSQGQTLQETGTSGSQVGFWKAWPGTAHRSSSERVPGRSDPGVCDTCVLGGTTAAWPQLNPHLYRMSAGKPTSKDTAVLPSRPRQPTAQSRRPQFPPALPGPL